VSTIPPTINFYAGADGGKLAARVWQIDEPIADVIYLHGIVSHSGWYESSCSHLAGNGFQVHFLDRRGSGLNSEERGDVDDWQTWIADVRVYLEQLPHDRPRIILGISWGGILATCLARRHPELLSGFGLICPGLFSHKSTNRAQKIALRLAWMLGLRRRKVPIPLQDPALFTNSAEGQRYIAHDPLALRKITIRFAVFNLALLEAAIEAPEEIHLPVLLALASADPITENVATRAFVDRLGHPDRTIVEYPGASHTLEFEQDPSQYFRDLTEWCKRIAL
jgi:alpha-beta hydrolase superfamily lysophospholipase